MMTMMIKYPLPTLHLDLSVDPLEVKDCASDYDDCDHDNDDNDDKMPKLHLDLFVDPSASDDYVGPQDNFLREKNKISANGEISETSF